LLFLLFFSFIFDYHSRLHDQIILFASKAYKIQIIDGLASGFRLLCVLGLKVVSQLSVSTVIFVTICTAGLRVYPVRKLVGSILVKDEKKICASNLNEIKAITKRQFPLEVFYVLQAQLVLVLLALYGDSSDTATVGALGRIGQLFLPIMAFLNAYSIPRFSRVAQHLLVSNLILWSAVATIPGAFLCFTALFFPEWLLFLVGDNYANYQNELLVSCIFFSFNAVATCIWQLLANRGLNKYAYVQVPVFVLWCLIAPLYLDLSTLMGVLWFQVGFPMALLMSAAIDLYKELKLKA